MSDAADWMDHYYFNKFLKLIINYNYKKYTLFIVNSHKLNFVYLYIKVNFSFYKN